MSTKKSPFSDMGCTCFTWETDDHMHLLGRTYDQCGNLQGNRIAVIPRNYPLKLEINEKFKCICSQYLFHKWSKAGPSKRQTSIYLKDRL